MSEMLPPVLPSREGSLHSDVAVDEWILARTMNPINGIPLSPYPLPIPSSWGEGVMLLVKQNVVFSLAP